MQELGFRAYGFRVQGLGFHSGLGLRALGLQVSGFGFFAWSFGFRAAFRFSLGVRV